MVTPYTGPRQQMPAPKKRWPFATALIGLMAALFFAGGVAWWWGHVTPPPPEIVVATVTVLVTQPAPTPRTIVVYEPATVQVEVTRTVLVTATPSPPSSPSSTAAPTRPVVQPDTGQPRGRP